jgi:Zn-dependent protease with chaperone function
MTKSTRKAAAATDRSREQLARALWPQKPAPVRVLACRHCGRSNKVPVPAAALDPESCECGACGGALFLGPDEPLTGLASSAYEHALDRKSLDAMKGLPGFSALLRWVLGNVVDRHLRILQMSESVRCGEEQFPELVAMLDQARGRLDYQPKPDLYLKESPSMNAFAGGVGQTPMVGVVGSLLDQCNDAELLTVLGHEIGHLKAEHSLFHAMAHLLNAGVGFGVGQLLTLPIRKALFKWQRCSELTADRAGLLASRDFLASLTLNLKFAGGNRPGVSSRTEIKLAPYVQQARDLAQMESDDWLDGVVAALVTLDRSHPFAAWRLMHLLQWVENGSYLEILSGRYERRAAA